MAPSPIDDQPPPPPGSTSVPDEPDAPDNMDEPSDASRLSSGIGWLVGPLLSLVFLGYPIQTAVLLDPTPGRMVLTIGGTALFGGTFVWLLWTGGPFRPAPTTTRESVTRRLALIFLAAVVVAVNLGLSLRTEWLVLFFHTSVASGLILRRREAFPAVAALAGVAVVIASRGDLAFIGLPTAAIGLWAIAFAGQVAAVAELRVAREELARRAVAEERLRFARDLHDLLGHSLSLIALKSELAGKLLADQPERAAREIRETEEVARRALREVRQAVAGYRQPTLAEELIGVCEMLDAAGIASHIDAAASHLSKPADALLAWAVREAVTNVIRHSGGRHCTIRTSSADSMVSAEVTDDGRTPVQARAGSGGSGLAGLAERVAEVAGATFEAGPLPEGGFRLRVSLPLDDGQANSVLP